MHVTSFSQLKWWMSILIIMCGLSLCVLQVRAQDAGNGAGSIDTQTGVSESVTQSNNLGAGNGAGDLDAQASGQTTGGSGGSGSSVSGGSGSSVSGGSGSSVSGGSGTSVSGGNTGSQSLTNPLKSDSFTGSNGLLTKIIEVLLIFALPIIVLFIMYAGFMYVTAAGDTAKIATAHAALTWAVVGGVIVLGTKLIMAVIQNTIKAF